MIALFLKHQPIRLPPLYEREYFGEDAYLKKELARGLEMVVIAKFGPPIGFQADLFSGLSPSLHLITYLKKVADLITTTDGKVVWDSDKI